MPRKEPGTYNKSQRMAHKRGWEFAGFTGRFSARLYRKDTPHGIIWLKIPDGQRPIEIYDFKVCIRLARREWITWGKHWEEELLNLKALNFKEL